MQSMKLALLCAAATTTVAQEEAVEVAAPAAVTVSEASPLPATALPAGARFGAIPRAVPYGYGQYNQQPYYGRAGATPYYGRAGVAAAPYYAPRVAPVRAAPFVAAPAPADGPSAFDLRQSAQTLRVTQPYTTAMTIAFQQEADPGSFGSDTVNWLSADSYTYDVNQAEEAQQEYLNSGDLTPFETKNHELTVLHKTANRNSYLFDLVKDGGEYSAPFQMIRRMTKHEQARRNLDNAAPEDREAAELSMYVANNYLTSTVMGYQGFDAAASKIPKVLAKFKTAAVSQAAMYAAEDDYYFNPTQETLYDLEMAELNHKTQSAARSAQLFGYLDLTGNGGNSATMSALSWVMEANALEEMANLEHDKNLGLPYTYGGRASQMGFSSDPQNLYWLVNRNKNGASASTFLKWAMFSQP